MAVERSIWNEAEGAEAERLLDELDDLLDEEALSDAFTEDPVEAHIARIRDDLGFLKSAHPRDREAAARSSQNGDPSRDSTAQAEPLAGETGWRSSA
jgi:hypothetical protein